MATTTGQPVGNTTLIPTPAHSSSKKGDEVAKSKVRSGVWVVFGIAFLLMAVGLAHSAIEDAPSDEPVTVYWGEQ